MNAPRLELGGLGIFVLVYHVFIHTLVHEFVDLRINPGLTEGGQVLSGVSVEHQFVVYKLVYVPWIPLFLREMKARYVRLGVAGSVAVVEQAVFRGLPSV
ncbi:MAG: hypothetical protein PHU72_07615 [Dethiosulfovibrio sp.]|nr:hypothetical protein [Dethiosulfovibrio sp.]